MVKATDWSSESYRLQIYVAFAPAYLMYLNSDISLVIRRLQSKQAEILTSIISRNLRENLFKFYVRLQKICCVNATTIF